MPRELIDTGTDQRYVRRDAKGQFEDVVDVGALDDSRSTVWSVRASCGCVIAGERPTQ